MKSILEYLNESKISIPVKNFSKVVSDSNVHDKNLKYALDFICPIKTEVLAALPGTVIDLKDNSKEYGFDLKYSLKANYITIQHQYNLFSQYIHLGFKDVKVKLDQKISQNQIIALTGLSGYMSEPHLHFHICKFINDTDWETVPVHFKSIKIERY